MATGDGTNLSTSGTPAAASLAKEDARAPAVAIPAHHSALDRHWIPDERDAFILWLRGEFAAANAIIDTLCRHLQLIGQPGEYDYALTCIQQRRYNWTVVLHMQQYFSVAEVVIALQQVLWRKQQQQQQGLNPDHGPVQLHAGSLHADQLAPQLQPPPPLLAISDQRSQPSDHASGKDTKAPAADPDSIHPAADKRSTRDQGREPAADPAPEPLNSQQDKAKDASQNAMLSSDSHEAGVVRQQIEASAASNTSPGHSPADGSKEQTKKSDWSKDSPASKQEASQDPPQQEERPAPSPTPLQRAKSLDANHTFYEQLGSPQLSNNPTGNFVGAEFQFSSSDEENRRLAQVKSIKNFNCIEMIEGKPINVVGGLELYENVFDETETFRLAALVNELVVSGKRREAGRAYGAKRWQREKGRETMQFSLPRSDTLDEDDKPLPSLVKDETAESVPGFFLAVAERLVHWQILPASKRPDFCTINVSEEGDYIRPHGDHHHCERPFCTLSLSADCTMVFGRFLKMDRPGEFSGPFKLTLQPGSVLVFQGNSADIARCAIPTLPARRIALTFGRKLPSKNSKVNLAPAASWTSSSNRQGGGGSSVSSAGSPSRGGFGPLKSHNIAPTSGVLPVPSVRPSGALPQLSPGIQPLLPTTVPHTTGFSGLQVLSPAWSTVTRPTRPPTAGTGVFFPSSGSSSTGPGRPASTATQRRQGVLSVAPTLHKTSSSPASFCSLDGPAPSTPPPSSSRLGKSAASGQTTPENPDQGASTNRGPGNEEAGKWKAAGARETPAEGGVKSEANGSRTSNEEPASKACGLSKAAASNRVSMVILQSTLLI